MFDDEPEEATPGNARRAYINALRAADGNDFHPLSKLLLENRESGVSFNPTVLPQTEYAPRLA